MEQFLLPEKTWVTIHGLRLVTIVDMLRLQEMMDWAHGSGFEITFSWGTLRMHGDRFSANVAGLGGCDTRWSVTNLMRYPHATLPGYGDTYAGVLETMHWTRIYKACTIKEYALIREMADTAVRNKIMACVNEHLPVCISALIMEYIVLQEHSEARFSHYMQFHNELNR